jgi:hypothetical protein
MGLMALAIAPNSKSEVAFIMSDFASIVFVPYSETLSRK